MTAEQRTPEWYAVRLGNLTASRMADATATTRTGWGASRAKLMAELLAERFTGEPYGGYDNEHMQWGRDTEPLAVAAYEFHAGVTVCPVAYVPHPTIPRAGASPDGLVGEDGLLEIKSPNSHTHIDTLLGANIPLKYMKQMQWQLAATQRKWVDFVSFDPRLPLRMQLAVERVERNEECIEYLEYEAREFLRELDEKEAALKALYPEQQEKVAA